MIAVSIGVGSYAAMAQSAAQAMAQHTGLPTRVLGDEHYARSGLSDPMHLKFRLFDLVEDEQVLYFDADQVCLQPWDPRRLMERRAVVCVRDRMQDAVREDCRRWRIPPEEYFNAGLFIVSRGPHQAWLRAAQAMATGERGLRFGDQTALNATRCRLGLPLRLVNRCYNWVGFGEGSLCYRLPVFMAHSLQADKRKNLEFYQGRYLPPLRRDIRLDAEAMQRLAGRTFVYCADGEWIETVHLREDGTILPAADHRAAGHWFVQDSAGRPVLTLSSDTEILHRFAPAADGCWQSLEPVGEAQLIPDEAPRQPLVITPQSARSVAEAHLRSVPAYPQDRYRGRGIVICGGGNRYFPCAWVCIRMLRQLGCHLPVELWHLSGHELDAAMRRLLEPYDVRCVDASLVRRRYPVRILRGWELKPFAVLHGRFEQVLLLDADNVPIADPEYLFESEPFRQTGAVFWPDFGRLGADRAIWQICRVAYRDEPEFETGQILVDKQRCWRALNLTMHLNEHSDFYYRHVHGDKETFHMAWRMLDQAYAMVPTPIVALAGTMCQHDFAGRRIFQHRNMLKWLLNGPNARVRGFEAEELCLGFLQDLRQRWDGLIRWPRRYGEAEQRIADRLSQQRQFRYERIGHDCRAMELLADGRIGRGRGDCEEQWMVRQERSGRMVLILIGQGLETCRLVEDDAGWAGRWLVHERMPVRLDPVCFAGAEASAGTGSSASAGNVSIPFTSHESDRVDLRRS